MPLALPKQVLTDINKALGMAMDAHNTLDRLERVGQDVSDARAQVTSWQDIMTRYKQEFFPESR